MAPPPPETALGRRRGRPLVEPGRGGVRGRGVLAGRSSGRCRRRRPPGALLARLAPRYRLAILSNWPLAVTIDRYAEAAGWAPYLRAIVVSQRVGAIKPHPAIFAAALEALGEPAGRAVGGPPRRRRLGGGRRRRETRGLARGVAPVAARGLAAPGLGARRRGRAGPGAGRARGPRGGPGRRLARWRLTASPPMPPVPSVHSAAWRRVTGSRTWPCWPAAGVAWILVAVLVTTRDPYPGADGRATSARSCSASRPASPPIPLAWLVVFARHRRIAYQGDWTRAARRGAWVGLFVAIVVVLRLVDAFQLPDRPVPRRDLRRRRDHPVRRTLGAVRDRLAARRPARRPVRRREGARRRRRRGRARRDHRPQPPDPREPGARLRGGPGRRVGRRGDRPPRLRGGAPRRQPRDGGPRPPRRRQGHGRPAHRRSSPSTTRCPGSATAAATTRWRRRAWARRSRSRRSATRSRARSCSSGRPPRSGGAARRP